jgi:hypothetical protein
MAAQTSTRRAASARSFGRSTSAPPRGRFARSAAAPSRGPARTRGLRRRPAKPSGLRGLIGGFLPGAAAAKATPGSKKGKAGGFALAAAAAGVAFKNRDKLASLRGGRKHDEQQATPAAPAGTTIPGPVPR